MVEERKSKSLRNLKGQIQQDDSEEASDSEEYDRQIESNVADLGLSEKQSSNLINIEDWSLLKVTSNTLGFLA